MIMTLHLNMAYGVAIRESSLLACNNPAHQFHHIPDYNNQQNLKSVWYDCVMLMNKILVVLNKEYEIPKNLIKGAFDFEQQLPQK